ncbi:MAG: hypothetical protein ABJG88_13150 [Litorimonas sp.]
MFKLNRFLKLTVITALTAGLPMGTANAQFGDVSPVLLIESGPSDNPAYRRMIFVKYLSGNRVGVNYAAYNRTSFIQTQNTTPADIIAACANGAPTSLREIQAFKKSEAKLKRAGAQPEVKRFCIKNVQKWEGGGRDKYLDPIFEGMPYASALNN